MGSLKMSEQSIKPKQMCLICKTKIEYDRNPAKISGTYYDNDTLCSAECYYKAKEIAREENFKRYLCLIPKKFQTIEHENKELRDKLLGKSLFITGKTGIGKTVLMSAMVKAYLKDFKQVKWISYPAFIMELQCAFRKDTESPFDIATEVARFEGWLAIDDIGAEKLTDFVRQITYYILNEREQRELPIMITSNFSLAEIDEMIDPRISSRIAGMCEVVKLTGKDRRIKP